MVQVVVNGLVNGAVFALIAVSLTLIFSILRVPHFGLGGILVWGAFAAHTAVTHFGVNFWAALVVAAVSMAGLGVVVEFLAFRRLRGASEDAMFVSAVGVLIALENAAFLIWGDGTNTIPVAPMLRTVVSFGGVYLPGTRILILVVATAAYVALYFYVRHTRMGKAMRAVAQDRGAASLLGVPLNRVAMSTFAIGSGLAGLAGAIMGAAFSFNYESGSLVILRAFVVVVLGGLGSVAGTIAGGVILGIVDSFTQTYVTSQYKQLVGFSVLIIVLVVRPSGLFGERAARADVQGASA